MNSTIRVRMEHEIAIRLISFILIFFLIALWKIRMARRVLTTSKKWRWFTNYRIGSSS